MRVADRRLSVVLLLGTGFLSGCPNPKPAQPPTPPAIPCTIQSPSKSDQSLTVATSSDPAAATTLTENHHLDVIAKTLKVSRSIDRAGANLYKVEGTVSSGGKATLSYDFGAGFSGMKHADVARNGNTLEVTIDGRKLKPLTIGGDGKDAVFVDGQAGPALVIDPATRDAIVNVLQQATNRAPTCVMRAPGAPAPNGSAGQGAKAQSLKTESVGGDTCHAICWLTGDSCGCCETCCSVAYFFAVAAAFTAVAACTAATGVCAATFFLAEAVAEATLVDCLGGCAGGPSCCGAPCTQGTASQDCPFTHCSEGAVCCGGASCCDSNSDCCGTQCINENHTAPPNGGTWPVEKCANGTVCLQDDGDLCGSGCCPGTSPVCRRGPPNVLCCAQGAGDICRSNTTCCPSNQPRCISNQCCGQNDVVCGKGSQCCPPPSKCVGDTCCNPPSTVCGSNCCAAGQTCTPKRNLCCGGLQFGTVPCGNDCCVNNEACIAGSCCPAAQACGQACCPDGQICLNPGSSTCGAPQARTIQVFDSLNLYMGQSGGAPIRISNSMALTLKGLGFTPAVTVTFYADSTNGANLGTASPDGGGHFTATVQTNLWFSGGPHQLLAVQVVNGNPVTTTVALNVNVIK